MSEQKTGLRDTGARYELDEQGLTSWADYRRSGDRLYIDHVESPVALRGTGAAGLRRSKEFGDLVG
jgi:predicted GNAT family acetyltransferase